jgi:hypothetical protein
MKTAEAEMASACRRRPLKDGGFFRKRNVFARSRAGRGDEASSDENSRSCDGFGLPSQASQRRRFFQEKECLCEEPRSARRRSKLV